ncbi:myofilin isoform X2 [Lycorma delicatula]|uniref:myofilin isoform X2 n=1 Tax=Lycorma delicatula TaxID=130591 RepID=UPI003F519BAE
MLLKNHLDMIGRNEPIQRKARFWQSYVRALKGTDDMRAPEKSHYSRYPSTKGIFRPILSSDFPTWPSIKSIYDDPIHPSDRIAVPGYRYLPISREIYGISPRNIYPHHYTSAERFPPHDPLKALRDQELHDARIASIEALFPPEYRHPWMYRPKTPAPKTKLTPRAYTPTPKSPSEKVAQFFNYAGQPIYTRGGYTRRPLTQLLEPSVLMPKSMITRDPWWHEYPELRPFSALTNWANSPFYLRDSYLSPIKRTFLWADHPRRPFGERINWPYLY